MAKAACLITGGSGFIGTHLIEYLLKEDRFSKIYVLDLRKPSSACNIVEYLNCDINYPVSIEKLSNCDTCYHLAALCKEPGYNWDEYFITNHIGTKNVCELAERIGINNIIFTSTMMVFRAGDIRNNEEALTAPDTAYGMSKLSAELMLKEWVAKSTRRRFRIVRPGVVFGRGESANFTRLYNALKKHRFAYMGRKETVKGCVYVKDLVRFLDFVTDDHFDRTTYNFVYPNALTIEDICNSMVEVFEFNKRIPVIPYKLALLGGYLFEILFELGLKTSIHHRRIQKLYYSTDISADPAMETGFKLNYSLKEALLDWQKDCLPNELY